ncbi:hCG2039787, partial [Homo sapiens]
YESITSQLQFGKGTRVSTSP